MYTGEESHYPLAGGHEVSGELVKLGSRVHTDAQIGDRVAAALLTRCGYCESCRRGLDNICDNMRKPFREADVPGPAGLAEYVLLDDYQLYKADNEVSFEEICLTEPLACVVHSVRKARVERADNVVVVGTGIMGLLHLVLAKQMGTRVIVSELNEERAAFAEEVGADVVEQSLEAVAKGGRVHVYASIHPRGTKISVDPNLFHAREIVLTGTMSQSKEDVLQAVRMISRGLVDLKPFISLVLPFDRLEEGLQSALRLDTYRVVMTM
jgi:threonine dehydrogenase-like Zn-dependent dehydrogenase